MRSHGCRRNKTGKGWRGQGKKGVTSGGKEWAEGTVLATAHSPPQTEMEPKIPESHQSCAVSKSVKPLGKMCFICSKCWYTEDDNLLLLSLILLAEVAEVCVEDLKAPTLLMTHEGVNVMLYDGIGFFSFVFKT